MKVLFICNYRPNVGGISGQVEALQHHLLTDGHLADVFSTKGTIFQRLCMTYKLKQTIKNYDVIHIHCCSKWGFLPAIIGINASYGSNTRTVLTYHGGGGDLFFAKHERLVKYYLTRTDANIVLSGFLGRVFDEYRIPYSIIPNIIELDQSKYRVRNTPSPSFICTRSHETIYNIPCILKAFQIVQRKYSNATLTLVGHGSLHNELVSLSKRLRLNNVTFTGRVSNLEIYKYLDEADIMLSSPIVDNMPVSLLEAMNAGLLVISSNVGGVPYMIRNGENGFLFENDNHEELAEIMIMVINNPEIFTKITKNAHNTLKEYSWASVKDRIFSAYGINKQ